MQQNTGKSIFLSGLVAIVLGVVWDQFTPLPFFVISLGIISLILGTVLWFKSRQKKLLVTKTSIEPVTVDMAHAFWGIGVLALVVFWACRYFAGFSLANILPEHLQDSTAMKGVFFIGLGWTLLSGGGLLYFCWFVLRAIRVQGRVTSFVTQEKTIYHQNVKSTAKYYAEVITYNMGDMVFQKTGNVWMPFEPEMGKVRTVWVNRKKWDKALVASPLIFVAFGLFLVLGLAVLGFVFFMA